MKNILILSLSIFILACQKNEIPPNTFQLDVTTKGLQDNSLLLLQDIKGATIDTLRLKDNKARFTGFLENPKRFKLMAEGSNDYVFFWMEPNKMTLEAESGKFREAIIKGSKTELKDNEHDLRIQPFDDIMSEVETFAVKNQQNLTQPIIDSLRAVYNKAEKGEEKETQLFIAENPNSVVSIYLLDFYKTTYGKKIVKPLYEKFSPEMKTNEYGISVQRYLEINDEPKIGEPYRDVTLMDRNGEMISISDIDAKFLLIEFWSSRCAPCLITNPKLVKIYEKYQSQGFEIYGISLDTDKSDWLNAIEKDGLPWTNVVDLDGDNGDSALLYGVSAIPDNFLIDSEGKIIARKIWSETLDAMLHKLLP